MFSLNPPQIRKILSFAPSYHRHTDITIELNSALPFHRSAIHKELNIPFSFPSSFDLYLERLAPGIYSPEFSDKSDFLNGVTLPDSKRA